jgi:hypothetical protein
MRFKSEGKLLGGGETQNKIPWNKLGIKNFEALPFKEKLENLGLTTIIAHCDHLKKVKRLNSLKFRNMNGT